jgi:hypothetical protein
MVTPHLVNNEFFQTIKRPKVVVVKKKITLNMVLIVLFILFTSFFLYNCKYGYFKAEEINIYPFNISV